LPGGELGEILHSGGIACGGRNASGVEGFQEVAAAVALEGSRAHGETRAVEVHGHTCAGILQPDGVEHMGLRVLDSVRFGARSLVSTSFPSLSRKELATPRHEYLPEAMVVQMRQPLYQIPRTPYLDSLRPFARWLDTDPRGRTTSSISHDLGPNHIYARRFDESNVVCIRVSEIDPSIADAHSRGNECLYWSNRPGPNLCQKWLQAFAGKLECGCVRAKSAIDLPILASTGVAR